MTRRLSSAEAVVDIVDRRPWPWAAAGILAFAVALQADYSMSSGSGDGRVWLGYVVVGCAVYAALAVGYVARGPWDDPRVALVSFGTSAVPIMVSLPARFFGAPGWAPIVAFGFSSVLLLASALKVARRDRGTREG